MGELSKLAERDAILREHCEAIGRDEAEIERTTTVDIVIRDTHEAGLAYYKARLAANGEEFDPDWNFFVGPPAEIAEGLQPILALGLPPRAHRHAGAVRHRDARADRRARRAAERVTGAGRRSSPSPAASAARSWPRASPPTWAIGCRSSSTPATTASGTACS